MSCPDPISPRPENLNLEMRDHAHRIERRNGGSVQFRASPWESYRQPSWNQGSGVGVAVKVAQMLYVVASISQV